MIEDHKIQQNIYLAATSQAKSVPNRDFQTSAAGFDWRESVRWQVVALHMILLLAKPVSLHLTLLNLCLLFNAQLSISEFGEQNNGASTYNRYQPVTITPQQNDERLNQALAFAVIDGNLDVVKLTLSRGAEINAKDEHGWTPLFHAIKHGELEIASYLLENGAEVNLISFLGTTPLRLASAQGDIDMFKLLLTKGADANLTGDDGYTPLHRAAEDSKNVEVVRMLISHGAKVMPSLEMAEHRL